MIINTRNLSRGRPAPTHHPSSAADSSRTCGEHETLGFLNQKLPFSRPVPQAWLPNRGNIYSQGETGPLKLSREGKASPSKLPRYICTGGISLAIFFESQPRIDMRIFSSALGGWTITIIVLKTFITVVAFIITELSGLRSYGGDLQSDCLPCLFASRAPPTTA